MTAPPSPRYHFITGLPRAGSTLLSALLLQNPRFHAGMTSPVGGLFRGMLNQLGAGSEFGPVVTTDQRRRLARGLFDSYYADQAASKEVIFDTNRMWSAQMPALIDLFPGAKLIACVRNVAWVMDSIERRYRANPYEITRLFGNCEEAEKEFAPDGWKMRFDYIDGDPDKESQFYILKHTVCPAVLSENFFMDTEKDCRFMMTDAGRERIAKVHYNTIKRIL